MTATGLKPSVITSYSIHYTKLYEVTAPIRSEGGIAILFGNLAPDGAVVKQSGVSEKMMVFEGKARCFESEEAAMSALMGGQVVAGDVVVIRYSYNFV